MTSLVTERMARAMCTAMGSDPELWGAIAHVAQAALEALKDGPELTTDWERFKTWANGEGYDVAYAYDSERSRYVCWNPVTADLWRAWRGAVQATKDLAS